MSSINFDEETLRIDREIASMTVRKDVAALETSCLDFRKRRAEAMKNVNFCNKNIADLEQRVAEKKDELRALE